MQNIAIRYNKGKNCNTRQKCSLVLCERIKIISGGLSKGVLSENLETTGQFQRTGKYVFGEDLRNQHQSHSFMLSGSFKKYEVV